MAPITRLALTVALGGLLMGFDASVISGVVGAVEAEFALGKLGLGWVVASLTASATLAMFLSGPLANRFGRKPVLQAAALLYTVSALLSAIAPDANTLVAARMLGGLAVGAALVLAPLYIAELAPADQRGRLVSLNQLNIVIGISAAYFSNYLLLQLSQADLSWVAALGIDQHTWRWMLGVEAVPAVIFFLALFTVPESPRWLLMRGREAEAEAVMNLGRSPEEAKEELAAIQTSLGEDDRPGRLRDLLSPSLRFVLVVGLIVAVLQQATGINAVFFYAPMIFEQAGLGQDASFLQAVLVGLTNLVFTVVAIRTVDRAGRRPLLLAGLAGIAAAMALLAVCFHQASWTLEADMISDPALVTALQPMLGQAFDSDVALREAFTAAAGADAWASAGEGLARQAINVNSTLVLIGILGFVASFAVSLGPVMWVLFSELFPNRQRALAIGFVGLVNSAVSFLVQFLFPWQLTQLGASLTFAVYGSVAVIGFFLLLRWLPETKGRRLEDLEKELLRSS